MSHAGSGYTVMASLFLLKEVWGVSVLSGNESKGEPMLQQQTTPRTEQCPAVIMAERSAKPRLSTSYVPALGL